LGTDVDDIKVELEGASEAVILASIMVSVMSDNAWSTGSRGCGAPQRSSIALPKRDSPILTVLVPIEPKYDEEYEEIQIKTS
jgi:hypothetical protein